MTPRMRVICHVPKIDLLTHSDRDVDVACSAGQDDEHELTWSRPGHVSTSTLSSGSAQRGSALRCAISMTKAGVDGRRGVSESAS